MNTKFSFLTIIAACALSAAPGDITANVPFPFEFNGKAMPAGKYQIRPSADRRYTMATHANGPTVMFASDPTSGVAISNSNLQFQPVGGRYVLTAFVEKSTGALRKLPVARNIKESASNTNTVTVPITAAE